MASIPFNVAEIGRAIDNTIVEEMRELGELTAQALVFSTPVGMPELWQSPPPADYSPGHARFNWRVAINGFIEEERPGQDPGGGATVAEMRRTIRTLTDERQTLNFSLTIPYGFRLDAGHSTQRPRGFVMQALASARSAVSVPRRI